MNSTYTNAYSQLSKLVDEIEDDKIQLDTLAGKVLKAKELIELCEKKLRTIEDEVSTALTDKKPKTTKKTKS